LTPPDRAAVLYAETEARAQKRGDAGDRTFAFQIPERMSPSGQFGTVSSTVEWMCSAVLRLSQAGRSERELVDAVLTEGNLLARSIERTTSWPTGIYGVLTDTTDGVRDDQNGDALVTIRFRVICGETD
jgi:hypothetical protein